MLEDGFVEGQEIEIKIIRNAKLLLCVIIMCQIIIILTLIGKVSYRRVLAEHELCEDAIADLNQQVVQSWSVEGWNTDQLAIITLVRPIYLGL